MAKSKLGSVPGIFTTTPPILTTLFGNKQNFQNCITTHFTTRMCMHGWCAPAPAAHSCWTVFEWRVFEFIIELCWHFYDTKGSFYRWLVKNVESPKGSGNISKDDEVVFCSVWIFVTLTLLWTVTVLYFMDRNNKSVFQLKLIKSFSCWTIGLELH